MFNTVPLIKVIRGSRLEVVYRGAISNSRYSNFKYNLLKLASSFRKPGAGAGTSPTPGSNQHGQGIAA